MDIQSQIKSAKIDSSATKTRVKSIKGLRMGTILTKYLEKLKTKALCSIRRN